MGRLGTVRQLTQEQQSTIDRCIRAHRYLDLDAIVMTLKDMEVTLARSTLHRYVSQLRRKDSLCALPDEGTIVTLVERGTGEVRIVKTAASAVALAAMIEALAIQS